MRCLANARRQTEGSALLEFAIVLPLLVVFIVGIYDFSGAYIEKQKIGHAAQTGAIAAAGQATGDMDPTIGNPDSLQPVVNVIFNSLAAEGVLPMANQGNCKPASATVTNSQLQWTYTISDCSAPAVDVLTTTIDRGAIVDGPPATVSTVVTVSYPYHWRFNSVIQLVVPGASYAAITDLKQTATVHNQM
jgi:Flp pilus assembly protein TadG